MADHRSNLLRSGNRWCSSEELERLRREAKIAPYRDQEALEEEYLRTLARCGKLDEVREKLCLANAAIAVPGAGSWKLPRNNIWNVPDEPVNEVPFQYETQGPWGFIKALRGLVIDLNGCVYGMRSLSRPKQDGYVMRGYVSIGGKKHRVFTGTKLFERPDRTLCSVDVLIAHNPVKRGIFDV